MEDWDYFMVVTVLPFLITIFLTLWRHFAGSWMHTQAKQSFLDTRMKQGQVEIFVDFTREWYINMTDLAMYGRRDQTIMLTWVKASHF